MTDYTRGSDSVSFGALTVICLQARTEIRSQASSDPAIEAPETETVQSHIVYLIRFSDELQRNALVAS